VINDFAPDVVHLNSTKISILGSLAARGAKKIPRVIYTAHGWVFKEPMSFLKKQLYIFLERFTARFKDKIICIAKVDIEAARKTLKIKDNKLALIYHGLNEARYDFYERAVARQAIFEEMLGVCMLKEPYIVGSIGNLYATKDFTTFIAAMAELRGRTNQEIVGIVMGEGSERTILEEQIRDSKAKVHLIGRIANAANYLKAFDCYVCSSVKEGFPYTILEAMKAEVPIISTEVGGIPDIIDNGVNGKLVAAGDYKALAQDIIEIQVQPEVAREYASLSHAKLEEELSLKSMVEATLAVYSTI